MKSFYELFIFLSFNWKKESITRIFNKSRILQFDTNIDSDLLEQHLFFLSNIVWFPFRLPTTHFTYNKVLRNFTLGVVLAVIDLIQQRLSSSSQYMLLRNLWKTQTFLILSPYSPVSWKSAEDHKITNKIRKFFQFRTVCMIRNSTQIIHEC